MTYARSRLWLGISGVGSLVVLAAFTLWLQLPQELFGDGRTASSELTQLAGLTMLVALWLIPFDFLGGFWLPRKYGKTQTTFFAWLGQYATAVALQAILFVGFGCLILALSRAFGFFGGLLAVIFGVVATVTFRDLQISLKRRKSEIADTKMVNALTLIQSWQVFVPKTIVVTHDDPGFTGGVIGMGKRLRIVVPRSWLRFSTEQLATSIARRALAVETGSYQRGVLTAAAWNIGGFFLCSLLPEAGLTSVASLTTTICWFTLWSFVGLLTLPTISRNASLKVDQLLMRRGAPADWILSSTFTMDQLQDGEPERPALVETIFHPIPSVASRNGGREVGRLAAWNVARTTLFFSWACMGFLSRAVHCNLGRPELWTMLPSD